MAKGDLSGIAGVNSFNAIHPVRFSLVGIVYRSTEVCHLTWFTFFFFLCTQRKLFVSGLSKITSEAEVDVRRAELERAFRKYGGARGVTCIVPTNTTFAFVEMENERKADLALSEMAGKYRMNRARRSRHEALQEERASAEATKQGTTKESSNW